MIGKVDFYFKEISDTSVLAGIAVEYKNGKQLQHGNCGPKMFVQTWEPSGKENERLVAVSSCAKESPDQPQYCLGLKLFFETEEEVEEEKKEKAVTTQGSEAPQKTTATSDESKTVAAPVDAPKEKVIKTTDLWISGPKGDRENSMWELEAASHNPSTSEKWAVKGFMGQAGMDSIETIAVVWGRE